MAFFELTRNLFENTIVKLRPSIHFVSGSLIKVTGSEYVSPIRSKCIKEAKPLDYKTLSEGDLDASNSIKAYDESDYYFIDMLEECSARIKEAEELEQWRQKLKQQNWIAKFIKLIGQQFWTK